MAMSFSVCKYEMLNREHNLNTYALRYCINVVILPIDSTASVPCYGLYGRGYLSGYNSALPRSHSCSSLFGDYLWT